MFYVVFVWFSTLLVSLIAIWSDSPAVCWCAGAWFGAGLVMTGVVLSDRQERRS